MGGTLSCCRQQQAKVYPDEDFTSKQLDTILFEEKLQSKLDFKVLVLGAGESGKTTFSTQLRLLYDVMSSQYRVDFIPVLPFNAMSAMQNLLQGAEQIGIDLSEIKSLAKGVLEWNSMSPVTATDATAIVKLWKSQAVQKAYENRNKFYFPEAGPYYFNNVMRFVEPNFFPLEEDLVMARVRTTGMVTTNFVDGTVSWHIVDVGGQRSERKKWIQFFDNVKAVLYVVDLAGYNSVLYEDSRQNRMKESLSLFADTAAQPAFKDTAIFLVMNKEDLFIDMLESHPLKNLFPEYQGTNAEEAVAFLSAKFENEMPNGKKLAGAITMSARYKDSVSKSMEFIMESIINWNRSNIKRAMRAINESHTTRPLNNG